MPKPYPPEFRRRALDLLEAGRSVREVAACLGIAQSCLHHWKSRDLLDRGVKSPTPEQVESAALAAARARIAELETEVKILRKAPAAVEQVADSRGALPALIAPFTAHHALRGPARTSSVMPELMPAAEPRRAMSAASNASLTGSGIPTTTIRPRFTARSRICWLRQTSLDEDRWWRRRQPRRGLSSTVEPVTTVLVTAMVLVAVMFVVVVATLALAAHAHRRRQLDDARAHARHWVERLGGELLLLDGAAARLGTGSAAGLAEAAERFTAAGAELAAARTPRQCRIAQDTAVEGLHHVRTARRSLRLDPGPRVPGQGVGAVLRTALEDGTWSIPRLVDDVLVKAHGRARQLPAATMEPAEWIRRGQQRWMRPETIRRE